MGWQPADKLVLGSDVFGHLFLCDFMLNFKNPQENQVFDLHFFCILHVEIKKLATSISNQLLKRFKE